MKHIAERLLKGETVTFNPKGNSMVPLIRSGQEVTVSPTGPDTTFEVGDIVFCKVKGKLFLHKIYAVSPDGAYLIGNNKGFKNGWTRTIYGRVTNLGA